VERESVLNVTYHGRDFVIRPVTAQWIWWEALDPTKVFYSPSDSLAYQAIEAYVANTKGLPIAQLTSFEVYRSMPFAVTLEEDVGPMHMLIVRGSLPTVKAGDFVRVARVDNG